MNQSLAWLYGRQSSPAGNWLADAPLTQGATSSAITEETETGLVQCGISSQVNFLTGLTVSGAQEAPFAMSPIESIVAALPPGLLADNQLGPDGYPVNESGQAFPWGNLLVNGYEITAAMPQSINTLLYNANSTWVTPGLPQTPGVIAKWTANANYPFGSLIVDSNNNVQMALFNGLTANTKNSPNWPTTLGALTGDNTQIWKLIANGYQNAGWVAMGFAYNLLNAANSYRVDVFVHTDVWYYQGSSSLKTLVPAGGGIYAGGYSWSLGRVNQGMLLAALYPTSVAQPTTGWSGASIPTGWVSHTNTGVCQVPQAGTTLGGKLSNYKAQIYLKTDIEYLQEDNVPIIVQSDGFHARAGSSVILNSATGMPTVHILYNDPIVGWTEVLDSLGAELEYSDLPRSFDIPTSDPLYVPDPGATNIPAIQNRSFIYDCALAILAYTSAGNMTAAEKVVRQLNTFLANPGYLPSLVLENAEDGSAARWSIAGTGATVTNIAASNVSPQEPPYGTGNILNFHSGSAASVFTYTGGGFPDSTDTYASFEHMEAAGAGLIFDISLTTAHGLVTDIQVTSNTAGPATLAGTVITVPIGAGASVWRTTLLNLETLISSLASDTLATVTGFKLTLTTANSDLYFDNLSVGTLQPTNSLSFSYDTYNGQVDQAYIRAGAMAWVVYAYAVYMQSSQDYSSWEELQGMIEFLLTLQSNASDLTRGLFCEGYGQYVNPGYQFVPGLVKTIATEHQIDLWFAFMRAAGVLSNAAINLQKTGLITSAQATSISATVATIEAAANAIWTNLLANLYIAPAGNVAGHFAQGVTAPSTSGLVGHWALNEGSGSAAVDSSGSGNSGTWSGAQVGTNGYYSAGKNQTSAGAFDGSTDIITLPETSSLDFTGSGTLAAWVFVSGLPTSGGTNWIALKGSSGWGMGVRLVNNSGVSQFSADVITGGALQSAQGFTVATGAWYHVALVFNATTQTVVLYANGSLVATTPTAGSAIRIGGNSSIGNFPGQAQVWQGLIEDVRFYDVALTADGVAGLFTLGIDSSEALDASGHWAALLAHANGRDDVALQCAEFAYSTFLVTNQTVALSSLPNSYNEAFQVTTPFSGMKPYSDSPGGYSGSPASVWQEGSWGMILMLLDLYDITGLADFFTSLNTTIDAALTTLITGQATISQASGNGSLLAYSLAARGLPYEFDIWPALAPTAWMWLVATNPNLLLSVSGLPQLIPYMYVPAGAEQSIDDRNGSSSVGQMQIQCIDPGGLLHTLAAQEALIGQVVTFSMGFPGSSLGDFVPLHVMQISEIGFDADGRVVLKVEDLKRFAQGAFLWANGGPEEYLPGQKNTWQPSGAQWLANSYPVSNDNPRWVSGNPLDIFLAAMQNELGVGQDLALNTVVEAGSTGELVAASNPFWAKYVPLPTAAGGNPSTLINPNFYLDVAGITALRDGMFSGDWFEFKITSPQQARSWLEDQILKPLGLVMVVTASGQLTLKAIKNPVNQTPVAGIIQRSIVGIPEVRLAPVINALAYRLDADDSSTNTSARTYNSTVTMLEQSSFNLFRYLYNHQVESAGLKMGRGGSLRAFLLGDQLFRRYGFATPVYEVVTQLGALQPELKDWVSLTHPLVPDYIGGGRGVTNIPCEIIGRAPDYQNGQVRFTLLDMRRASTTSPYEIVPSASMVLPPYTEATVDEQETYFFITPSTNGIYAEALSTIF